MGKNIENEKIKNGAIEYVKENHRRIIKHTIGDILPADSAVAIFMAGSPGAGKTEFSIHFIEKQFGSNSIVRIDPDEIREELPKYNGQNAYLFQGAVSLIIEKVLDYVFRKNIHFLLDGTFSHLEVARKNIRRAISKNRLIQINYVYQPENIAWDFTQKREKIMNRRITEKIFDESCKNAKMVVAKIKEEFRDDVKVDLIVRNVKTNKYKYYFNKNVEEIKNIDKKCDLL